MPGKFEFELKKIPCHRLYQRTLKCREITLGFYDVHFGRKQSKKKSMFVKQHEVNVVSGKIKNPQQVDKAFFSAARIERRNHKQHTFLHHAFINSARYSPALALIFLMSGKTRVRVCRIASSSESISLNFALSLSLSDISWIPRTSFSSPKRSFAIPFDFTL